MKDVKGLGRLHSLVFEMGCGCFGPHSSWDLVCGVCRLVSRRMAREEGGGRGVVNEGRFVVQYGTGE